MGEIVARFAQISDYAGDHQNSDKKEIKLKPQSWKL